LVWRWRANARGILNRYRTGTHEGKLITRRAAEKPPRDRDHLAFRTRIRRDDEPQIIYKTIIYAHSASVGIVPR